MDFAPENQAQGQFSTLINGALDSFQKINTQFEYADAVSQYQQANIATVKAMKDPNDPNYTADPTKWADTYQRMQQSAFNNINSKFLSADAQSAFKGTFTDTYSKGLGQVIMAAGAQQIENYKTKINDLTDTATATGDMSALIATHDSMKQMLGNDAGDALFHSQIRKATTGIMVNNYSSAISKASASGDDVNSKVADMENQLGMTGTVTFANGNVYVGTINSGPNKGQPVKLGDNIDPSIIDHFSYLNPPPGGERIDLTPEDRRQVLTSIQQKANDALTNQTRKWNDVVSGNSPNGGFPAFMQKNGLFVRGTMRGTASSWLSSVAQWNQENPDNTIPPEMVQKYFAESSGSTKDPNAPLLDSNMQNYERAVNAAVVNGRVSQGLLDSLYAVGNPQWKDGTGNIIQDPALKGLYVKKADELAEKLNAVKMDKRTGPLADAYNAVDRQLSTLKNMMTDLENKAGPRFLAVTQNSARYLTLQQQYTAIQSVRDGVSSDSAIGGYAGGPYRDAKNNFDEEAAAKALKSQMFSIMSNQSGNLGFVDSNSLSGGVLPNAVNGPAMYQGYQDGLAHQQLVPETTKTGKVLGILRDPAKPFSLPPGQTIDQPMATALGNLAGTLQLAGINTGMISPMSTGSGYQYASGSDSKGNPGSVSAPYSVDQLRGMGVNVAGLSPVSSAYVVHTSRGDGLFYPDVSNAKDDGHRGWFYYPGSNSFSQIPVDMSNEKLGQVYGKPSDKITVADRTKYILDNIPTWKAK